MIEKEKSGVTAIFVIGIVITLFTFIMIISSQSTVSTAVQNITIGSSLEVGQSQPIVNGTLINNGDATIDLAENSTVIVTCNATVYDYNGYGDVTNISSWFFANGFTFQSSNDNNNHYENITSAGSGRGNCSILNGVGNQLDASCSFLVQYYANDTTWTCNMSAIDNAGYMAYDTDNIVVNSLLAISIPATLDFGVLDVFTFSNENNTNVTNTGNTRIDLYLDGYAQTAGDGYAMNCSYGQFIDVSNMKYNETTSFSGPIGLSNFSQYYSNLSGSPALASRFNLNERFSDVLNDAFQPVYWRVYVPSVSGNCTGNINFGAVSG